MEMKLKLASLLAIKQSNEDDSHLIGVIDGSIELHPFVFAPRPASFTLLTDPTLSLTHSISLVIHLQTHSISVKSQPTSSASKKPRSSTAAGPCSG